MAVWLGIPLQVLPLRVVVVEGDANPIQFSPHAATFAVDVVGVDDQREIGWNAHHACNFKCRPYFGKVADGAVDARTRKRDCSCL